MTGTYKTQYELKFAQSGLDITAQGTIVSVTIGANSPVDVAYGDFTKNFGYVDAGTTISYTFTSTVSRSYFPKSLSAIKIYLYLLGFSLFPCLIAWRSAPFMLTTL